MKLILLYLGMLTTIEKQVVTIDHVELLQVDADRDCGISAIATNNSRVTFRNVKIKIEPIYYKVAAFFVVATVPAIPPGASVSLGAPCPAGKRSIKADGFEATVLSLEPDWEATAAVRRAERFASECRALYLATSNKRIADLTVKESNQISSCRSVGQYR